MLEKYRKKCYFFVQTIAQIYMLFVRIYAIFIYIMYAQKHKTKQSIFKHIYSMHPAHTGSHIGSHIQHTPDKCIKWHK